MILTRRSVAETVRGCGEECELLTNVGVAASVRASCAVPGVFEPADVEGRVLVDGGVVDNVPARFVRRMRADLVIAVDVRKRRGETPIVNPMQVLEEATDIMVSQMSDRILAEEADMVIRPQLGDPTHLGRAYAAAAIAAGEAAARTALQAPAHPNASYPGREMAHATQRRATCGTRASD